MSVSYDSSKLIPGPFADITKTYQRNGAGEIIGSLFSITLQGTIVAYMGSPNSSGLFHTTSGYPANEAIVSDSRLGAILRKQNAIRELFSNDGRSLELQSADGTQPLKFYPRIVSVNFPAGQWFETCPYSIQMEADSMYPQNEDAFTEFISDGQESWQLESNEQAESELQQSTYRLSHTVSAIGKRHYDETGTLVNQPWEEARAYVLSRLGFDSTILLSSGVHNLPAYYGGFNHTRSSNRDEGAGAFSVTETWLIASGNATEDFTIDTQSAVTDPLLHVSIQGSINGLEVRDTNYNITSTKWTNALAKFTTSSGLALSRCQNYSGYTLNILPVSTTVGKNPVAGTISYSFDYDNRPSNIVSGALSEVISISDTYQTNIVGIVPVLGRARGPVLQDIGTSEATTRQLSIELVMPKPSFGSNSLADLQSALFGQRPSAEISGIINAANPANFGASQVFITSNSEDWNPKDGRYSRQISWVYE